MRNLQKSFVFQIRNNENQVIHASFEFFSNETLRNGCDESVRQLSELYIGHLFTSLTEQNKKTGGFSMSNHKIRNVKKHIPF